jgi:hypothetical protein
MIEKIQHRAAPRTHFALIDGMSVKRGDIRQNLIFYMNIDGAARFAHAAQGWDNPGRHNRPDIHRRCTPISAIEFNLDLIPPNPVFQHNIISVLQVYN